MHRASEYQNNIGFDPYHMNFEVEVVFTLQCRPLGCECRWPWAAMCAILTPKRSAFALMQIRESFRLPGQYSRVPKACFEAVIMA